MTTPRSLTSSRYTGAEARRSLERTSVVSIITSWPIQASGIFPSESESEALGLSRSIIASSFARCPPASVGYLYRKPLALRRAFRLSRAASETPRGKRRPKDGAPWRIGRQDVRVGSPREHASVLVMCATIVGQVIVPRLGGKGHCTGRSTTSSKHWRYGTTRLCCSGWRSPLLTGGASLVRISLPPCSLVHIQATSWGMDR